MIKSVCDLDKCTGCGLCAYKCPVRCISMQEGLLGHLYPNINRKVCIKCGLCKKICPSLNPKEFNIIENAYACWSKDYNEYKTCTSGGIATELSKFIIENGGVVYGCSVLPGINVNHIRVDSKDDLYKLKGSKYVQSSLKEVWRKVSDDIKNGNNVLFIGTPCQVAAIKNMFNRVPDNLFLVDLICHGVPSLAALKRHVNFILNNKCYDNIIFRDGSPEYILKVYNKDKLLYYSNATNQRYHDWYLNAFLDSYILRRSCYNCLYARPQRVGDMTIGDFWGLGNKEDAHMIPAHSFGCSVVLTNNLKGETLLSLIRKRINIYNRSIEEAVSGNSHLRIPTNYSLSIRFFQTVNKYVCYPQLYYHIIRYNLIKESFIQAFRKAKHFFKL